MTGSWPRQEDPVTESRDIYDGAILWETRQRILEESASHARSLSEKITSRQRSDCHAQQIDPSCFGDKEAHSLCLRTGKRQITEVPVL